MTSRPQEPDIARLRELEAAVPPAPWFYPVGGGIAAKTPAGWEVLAIGEMEPAAAEFLVAARNALPELLDVSEARQQGRPNQDLQEWAEEAVALAVGAERRRIRAAIEQDMADGAFLCPECTAPDGQCLDEGRVFAHIDGPPAFSEQGTR